MSDKQPAASGHFVCSHGKKHVYASNTGKNVYSRVSVKCTSSPVKPNSISRYVAPHVTSPLWSRPWGPGRSYVSEEISIWGVYIYRWSFCLPSWKSWKCRSANWFLLNISFLMYSVPGKCVCYHFCWFSKLPRVKRNNNCWPGQLNEDQRADNQ